MIGQHLLYVTLQICQATRPLIETQTTCSSSVLQTYKIRTSKTSREKVVLKRVNKNLSDKKKHALKVLMKIKMKNDRRGRYRDISRKKNKNTKV